MPRTAEKTCNKRKTCSRELLDVLGRVTQPVVWRASDPLRAEIRIVICNRTRCPPRHGRKQPGVGKKLALKHQVSTTDEMPGQKTGPITQEDNCSAPRRWFLVKFYEQLIAIQLGQNSLLFALNHLAVSHPSINFQEFHSFYNVFEQQRVGKCSMAWRSPRGSVTEVFWYFVPWGVSGGLQGYVYVLFAGHAHMSLGSACHGVCKVACRAPAPLVNDGCTSRLSYISSCGKGLVPILS